MAKLIVAKERFVVQELELPDGGAAGAVVFVGRNESNDVCLPSLRVSKRHASIERRGGHVYVTDLGSTNGTLVNGNRLEAYRELELYDGDAVDISPYLIHCAFPERRRGAQPAPAAASDTLNFAPDAPVPAAGAGAALPFEAVRLDYTQDFIGASVNGQRLSAFTVASGDLRIGRAPTDTIRLGTPGPLETAARLFRADHHYFLVVLSAFARVTVLGQPLLPQHGPYEVLHDDIFTVDEYAFQCVFPSASTVAAAVAAGAASSPYALGAPASSYYAKTYAAVPAYGAALGLVGASAGGPGAPAARTTGSFEIPEFDDFSGLELDDILPKSPGEAAGKEAPKAEAAPAAPAAAPPAEGAAKAPEPAAPPEGVKKKGKAVQRTVMTLSLSDDELKKVVGEGSEGPSMPPLIPPQFAPTLADLPPGAPPGAPPGTEAPPAAPPPAPAPEALAAPKKKKPVQRTVMTINVADEKLADFVKSHADPAAASALADAPLPPSAPPLPPEERQRISGFGDETTRFEVKDVAAFRKQMIEEEAARRAGMSPAAPGAAPPAPPAEAPAAPPAAAAASGSPPAVAAPPAEGETEVAKPPSPPPVTAHPIHEAKTDVAAAPGRLLEAEMKGMPTEAAMAAAPPAFAEAAPVAQAGTTAFVSREEVDRLNREREAKVAEAQAAAAAAAGAAPLAPTAPIPTHEDLAAKRVTKPVERGHGEATGPAAAAAATPDSETVRRVTKVVEQRRAEVPGPATAADETVKRVTRVVGEPIRFEEAAAPPAPPPLQPVAGDATRVVAPPAPLAGPTPIPAPPRPSATVEARTPPVAPPPGARATVAAAPPGPAPVPPGGAKKKPPTGPRPALPDADKRPPAPPPRGKGGLLVAAMLLAVVGAGAAYVAFPEAFQGVIARVRGTAGTQGPTGASGESSVAASTGASTEASVAASTEASTGESVAASTEATTGASTGLTTAASTEASAGASTAESTAASVAASAGVSTEASTGESVAASVAAPVGASTEASTAASTEATAGASTEATTGASTEPSTAASTGESTAASTEATTGASTEASTAASTEATAGASTEATTGASTEASTAASAGESVAASTGESAAATTGASTEASAGASTEATTGASTEASTAASTGESTAASTEGTTGASTVASAGASTEASTAASTGESTAASTEGTTGASTEASTGESAAASTGASTEASTAVSTGESTAASTEGMTGASTEASAGASTEASSGASTAATTGASSEAAPVPPDPLAWAAGIALPAGVRPTETPGEFVNEADGSVLVRVPAGPALIGSAPGEGIEADETPAHEVRLEEYFMGKTEVTNAQYARFLAWLRARPSGDRDISHPLQPFDKSHVPDSDASIAWTASGKAPEGIEDLPVVLIDWYDAYAYCHWAGGTLPSEAQWERAAGQGEPGAARRRFPWGDVYEKGRAHVADVVSGRDFASAEEWAAWHDRIASGTAASWPAGRISKVGAYPEGASPLGLLDVSGNAREWCLDFYDAEFYARSPERNPVNLRPTKEGMRVNRGGCWINYPPNARVSYRDYAAPSFRSEEIGFRLCIPGKSR